MEAQSTVRVPRVAIRFCTQCKWNLRAAYYAQELLQTFSTTLGEVSLIPTSGGVFDITLSHLQSGAAATTSEVAGSADPRPLEEIRHTLVWDRKRDGGFPETKELKNRIRNLVDPERDMGHIDRSLKKAKNPEQGQGQEQQQEQKQDQNQSQIQSDKSDVENTAFETPKETPSNLRAPTAAGSENLEFGDKLLHSGPSRTQAAGRDDCEDCK